MAVTITPDESDAILELAGCDQTDQLLVELQAIFDRELISKAQVLVRVCNNDGITTILRAAESGAKGISQKRKLRF